MADLVQATTTASEQSSTPALHKATPSGTASSNQPLSGRISTGHGSARPSGTSRVLNVSNATSSSTSPLSSRDPSPSRPGHRHSSLPAGPKRSRMHSSQDPSPTRVQKDSNDIEPPTTALQRALSSTNTPHLQHSIPLHSPKATRSQKTSEPASENNTPHWPISPRLKSPPPNTSNPRKNSLNNPRTQPSQPSHTQQRSSQVSSTPNIVVQSSTPPSATAAPTRPTTTTEVVNSDSDDQAPLTMKGSARATNGPKTTLETVQEGSLPTSPGFELAEAQSVSNIIEDACKANSESNAMKTTEDLSSRTGKLTESGSDSGGNNDSRAEKRNSERMTISSKPSLSTRTSLSSLAPNKSRAVNEAKNMTVETETVPSIPQASLGTQADRTGQGRSDGGGSVRMKASNETIRPKKDRKKPARKAPSINSGTASSKADIFEAKVASAVDEADDSESDETFVYESNPPESDLRSSRHHSRTPSATSMASLIESRQNVRSIGNVLETQRPTKQRSMKFASNTYNHHSPNYDTNDGTDGTVRIGTTRMGGGNSIHHHHIGRHGRGPPSIFDNDSPFPHSTKGRASRQSSRPSSPRLATHSLRHGNGTKQNSELSMYDMGGEAADDERTPLIGTVRASRNPRTPRTPRPVSASIRRYEPFPPEQGGWLRRFAGCIVMTVMVVLLVAGAVGFLFATTKPLYKVELAKIENVLASEQELMLDLLVRAINPNVISITVSNVNLNVFAKSKFVGTDRWWRDRHPHEDDDYDHGPWLNPRIQRRRPHSLADDKVRYFGSKDDGTDPIEKDPEEDAQTMLLGRIYQFDSALVFEGSALQRKLRESVGEVRLSKPGNETEAGGTERWERVIQHPFELIIRGVLRYELPLSSRPHTASISGRVIVHPEHGIGGNGTMLTESIEEHNGHGGGDLFSDEIREEEALSRTPQDA